MGVLDKFGTEVDSNFVDYNGSTKIIEAGFHWYRHLDVSWAKHQPGERLISWIPTRPTPYPIDLTVDAWDDALNTGIALATTNSMQTSIMVRTSPGWATTTSLTGCSSVSPTYYMEFARFLDEVIKFYKVAPYNVLHYELFNEPDDTTQGASSKLVGCWSNPTNYYNMLKIVYPYIKARHPTVKIINGGFTLYPSSLWARDFIKMGGLAYIDILAYHSYDYIKTGKKLWENAAKIGTGLYPTQYHAILNALRSWIASSTYNPSQIKLTIPIWMNEGACIGYPGAEYPTNDELKRIQSYYAAFMAATMVSSNALFITPTRLNIELYSWWVSQGWDHSYGQTVKTGEWYYETNVLYDALKFALAQVNGCTHTSVTQSATSASIIKLAKSGGQALWLLWNTNTVNSSDISYTFASAPYKVWDVWGNDITGTLTNSGKTLAMTDTGAHTNVVWAQLTA